MLPEHQQRKTAKQRLEELRSRSEVYAPVVAVAELIESMKKETDQVAKKGSAARLALHYVKVKEFRDQLDEVAKALTIERDRLAFELIPRAFQDEGTTTLTLAEGYRVTLTPYVRASIKEGQREDAYDWLRDGGNQSLITETVNASTLSAFVKSLLAENKEVPEALFNINVGQNTSVTKVQK